MKKKSLNAESFAITYARDRTQCKENQQKQFKLLVLQISQKMIIIMRNKCRQFAVNIMQTAIINWEIQASSIHSTTSFHNIFFPFDCIKQQ